jgi:3-oxoacyl-(acyl-carrier-protein) synthase
MTAENRRDGPVEIVGMGVVQPASEPQRMEAPPGLGLQGCPAYAWSGSSPSDLVSPNTLRRLGRAQRMALVAAHLAVQECAALEHRESVAVSVGTGLGALGETVGFLENMIEREEQEPKPTRFINSVHNSLASQIALTLGFRAENHTFTHQAISFELALWQALRVLHAGHAPRVLACGADELNPYIVAVGCRFGWWRQGAGRLEPMAPGRRKERGTLPGEGAAAFLLAPPSQASRTARIRTVRALPVDPRKLLRMDARHEVDFIERALCEVDAHVTDVDFLLLGANGDGPLDTAYAKVAQGLSSAVGRPLRWGVFKHLCGEYYTASAFGLAVAARMVREGHAPPGVEYAGPGCARERPISSVLLYCLSRAGYHSLCWVTS